MSVAMTLACPRRLAVIGAGSKAIALAAKVAALHRAGCPFVPTLDIFERTGSVGSTWSRNLDGYSDGMPLVCTPPFRDIGFPYWSFSHADFTDDFRSEDGEGLLQNPRMVDSLTRALDTLEPNSELWPVADRIMRQEYSLFAWLTRFPNDEMESATLKAWVEAGGRRLIHQEFSDYLKWVLRKARRSFFYNNSSPGIELYELHEVSGVRRSGDGLWQIEIESRPTATGYHGVIISGNGPSEKIDGVTEALQSRIFDAKDFWARQRQFEAELRVALDRDREDTTAPFAKIAVVGAGGAATSIANRVLQYSENVRISMFGRPAALFSRTGNAFEEQYYGDNEAWRNLSIKNRVGFLERLGSRASWSGQIEELQGSGRVVYLSREFVGVSEGDIGGISLVYNGPKLSFRTDDFDLLVDARGFQTAEYVADFLRDCQIKKKFLEVAKEVKEFTAERVPAKAVAVLPSMELAGLPPGLHVPNLCGLAGPAASNLMALGWLSTEILRPHVLASRKEM
jgi:mycobactin lysine-N-oxygenase